MTPGSGSKIGPDPVVVLAADDGFAMPLAVTVRSLLESLGSHRSVKVFILDGGIAERTKERLLRSWPGSRCQVEWLRPDASILSGLGFSDHVNLMTYFRLLIPRVLPAEVERVIYADADLLFRKDVGHLWEQEQAGHACLAVQDCAAPYIDAAQVLANYTLCGPRLAATRPVPNYQEFGLAVDQPYFNGGLLVMDLAVWRTEDLTARMIECLHRHREHVLWWDQYALNVVLAGRWGPLDLRWNQGSHLFEFSTWRHSPLDEATFAALRDDPHVVHFNSPVKPWHPWCPHPFRNEFFACLDRTDWAGWRPPRREAVRAWCGAHWKKTQKQLAILRRVMTAYLSAGLRRARGQWSG